MMKPHRQSQVVVLLLFLATTTLVDGQMYWTIVETEEIETIGNAPAGGTNYRLVMIAWIYCVASYRPQLSIMYKDGECHISSLAWPDRFLSVLGLWVGKPIHGPTA